VAALAALVGVLCVVALLEPAAVMWHRAVLVHLLVSRGAWWPRSAVARVVVVGGYLASALGGPWTVPAVAAALAVAVVVAVATERGRGPSVVRSNAWWWATGVAAAAVALPPVLRLLGVGREGALAVLASYGAALVVVAVLVVVATRPGPRPPAADLAVELRFPAREALERALAATGTGAADVAEEAEAALAAADRLRGRLAAREAELAAAVEETRRSQARLAAAEASERRRLRSELQDVTVARLDAVVARLEADGRPGPGDVATPVGRALHHLRQARDDLDALGRGLLPAPLDAGLRAALLRLGASSAVPLTFDLPDEGQLDAVPPRVAECVYFAAAEAVSNAIRHASASAVLVTLRVADTVALTVCDDGVGGAGDPPGRGISGLRERAAELGGRLLVTSPAGRGTVVQLTVPVGAVVG
jgi:signal transduction histidine kinase